MNKDNLVYVGHIFERAQKIIKFTTGMSEQDFLKDDKTQSAVTRELEVIGEASKRISDEFKKQHPHISWKLMAGMRDVLIHDYDGTDLLTIWNTVQTDIPILLSQLDKISGKK